MVLLLELADLEILLAVCLSNPSNLSFEASVLLLELVDSGILLAHLLGALTSLLLDLLFELLEVDNVLLLPFEDRLDLLDHQGRQIDWPIGFKINNIKFVSSHLLPPSLQHDYHLEGQAPSDVEGLVFHACFVDPNDTAVHDDGAATLSWLSADSVGEALRLYLFNSLPGKTLLIA